MADGYWVPSLHLTKLTVSYSARVVKGRLLRLLDKLPRAGKAQFTDLVTGDHPRQHLHAAVHIKGMDLGKGTVVATFFWIKSWLSAKAATCGVWVMHST